MPPWACAFVFAMLVAFLSDLLRHRFLFALASTALSLAGFAILLVVPHDTRLHYAALFVAAMGTYSAMPIVICWFTTNRTPSAFCRDRARH